MPVIRTCQDLCAAVLLTSGINGIGQTPLAEDINTTFQLLVEMIGTWQRERFMAWRLTEQIIPSTGAASYPMLDRPPRLDSAFARLLTGQQSGTIQTAGPVDFPLYLIDSAAEYNEISLKQLSTFPAAVWYAPDFTTGSLWFWPIPPAKQFELHVFYRAGLPSYTALTDELTLPPEYIRAARYELALTLQMDYGLPARGDQAAMLMGIKAKIRAANAHVAQLQMPASLTPQMAGQGGISGSVGPHQSVIVLDTGLAVLG
jgi:hypothetical protein